MSRVLAVHPEHVQDVGLGVARGAERVRVLQGGLEVAHDLLPDGPLHGQVALDVLDVLLRQRLAAPPLPERLVQDPPPPPPLLVLVTVLVNIINSLSSLNKHVPH